MIFLLNTDLCSTTSSKSFAIRRLRKYCSRSMSWLFSLFICLSDFTKLCLTFSLYLFVAVHFSELTVFCLLVVLHVCPSVSVCRCRCTFFCLFVCLSVAFLHVCTSICPFLCPYTCYSLSILSSCYSPTCCLFVFLHLCLSTTIFT